MKRSDQPQKVDFGVRMGFFFFFQTGEMNAFIKARKILFHVDITTKHKNYGFGDGFFKNSYTDNIIHVVGASGHRAERDL